HAPAFRHGLILRLVHTGSEGRFIVGQRRDRNSRAATYIDVVRADEFEKLEVEGGLRIVNPDIVFRHGLLISTAPLAPLIEDVQQISTILMESYQQPAKDLHAAQDKFAKLFDQLAIQQRRG